MFWFHGLSAGNRFLPRSVPRAIAIGIAMAQLKTKPPTNCILHQQSHTETVTHWRRESNAGRRALGDCRNAAPSLGSGLWVAREIGPSLPLTRAARGLDWRTI